MHTKTASLALLAFALASNAAPLPDRVTRSYARDAHTLALGRRGHPDCNDEATTYGLDSGKTEGDCANTPNAMGFKAGSVTAACSVPVKGSTKKGICYLGGATAQRRSPQDDPDAAPPSEDGEDAGGAEVKKPGKKAAEKKPEEPADQPPESSETPEEESGDAQPPSPEMPPQSPVKAPAPAEAPPPKSSTPSAPPKAPAPSATPPVTANTPGITTPRPNGVPGNHNTGTQSSADLTWVGKSMFKIFGGLF